MTSTIDSAGRVVIPKALRDRLNLRGGQAIEIREREGLIEIEAAATPMVLEESDAGVVAVAEEPVPPLTDEAVRDALERVRR